MRRYTVGVKPKEDSTENIFHMFLENVPAMPLEFKEGERGWFVYKNQYDEETPWHRINTSIVKKVKETKTTITVETENSIYEFKLEKDE